MCWQQNLLSQLSCGSLSIWFFSLQTVSMTLSVSLLLIAVCTVSSAWDLSPLGLDSALISHVTLCGTRAIINILRQDVHQPYSLLEASWPERPKPFFSFVRPYPSREPQVWKLLDERHALSHKNWITKCPTSIFYYWSFPQNFLTAFVMNFFLVKIISINLSTFPKIL